MGTIATDAPAQSEKNQQQNTPSRDMIDAEVPVQAPATPPPATPPPATTAATATSPATATVTADMMDVEVATPPPTTPPPTTTTTPATETVKATATATATATNAATESNNNSTRKSPFRAMWKKAVQRISKLKNVSTRATAELSSLSSTPI